MTSPAILIVDDEASHVAAICDVLGHIGYDVTGCTSAKDALTALSQARFDLVLADLVMPDMDGIALLRIALAGDPTLVGLIMTGAGTISTAVEAMKAGALDYVLKPFKTSEMMPVLARALKVRQLQIDKAALQTRLADRGRELESANAGLERMLAIVSHDMRAPLHGIDTCIRMLIEKNEVVPAGIPMCEAISEETHRLIDLATDLIDIDRLSRGHMPWHWAEIEPARIVRDTVAAFQALAAAAGTTLVANILFTGRMRGDGSACRRLITNLTCNAIRHAGATTITVTCRGEAGEIRFVIEDNGRGIPLSSQDRLGKPFTACGDEASPLGGVGLGLAICLGIAAAHGGSIAIRSRLRQGTRIIVALRGDLETPATPEGQARFRELDLA